jgi:hypothetical protein
MWKPYEMEGFLRIKEFKQDTASIVMMVHFCDCSITACLCMGVGIFLVILQESAGFEYELG